jgi:membrane protein required for beta-lactamase induction
MEDKMKWVVLAGGVGLVGYAVWQFLHESAKARRTSRRERQPWELT